MRIIQKGNVNDNGSYDIRITEENGKNYYYHVLVLEDGESIIYSQKPFNIKGKKDISWNELSLEFKEIHYKNAYPNANLNSYEKNCYLYGKQQADEIRQAEQQKKEEEKKLRGKLMSLPIDYFSAEAIYNHIGDYDKVKVISAVYPHEEYLIDDKWVVKFRKNDIVSVMEKSEDDKAKKDWGKRVNQIAKLAGTNYNIATIVGDITDIDEAVQTLKEVLKVLDENDFKERFCQYNLEYFIFGFEIPNTKIKNFFEHKLTQEIFNKLKFTKKFYGEVQEILKNKK